MPITDDTLADGGETFTLTLSNPSGVTRLVSKQGGWERPVCRFDLVADSCEGDGIIPVEFATTVSATGTIHNDEPGPSPSVDDLPLVTIRADSSYTGEGSDALFTLTRTGEVTEALTVPLSVRETGAMLDEPVPASATFAAGEQEAEFRVPTVDDDANEADSAVTAALRKGSGHRLGVNETQEATRTVLDDDAAPGPGATPASAGVTVWEADMTVVDYENGSIGAGSADLLANQRGSAGLQAKNLWYYAPDRKLHMALTTADAERLTLHAGNVSVVLGGGSPKHSWNDVDVDWTDGQTFVARLVRGETAGSPAPDVTLNSLGVSDAVLSPGFDPDVVLYTALIDAGTASVTLSAVANDDEGRVAFGPSEDADVEQPGHQVAVPYGESLMTVTVTAANGETKRAYRVVAMRPHATVSLRSASYTATEGGDAASVVVELSADPGQDVTIPLTEAPAGGADAADYTVPESVTFISGGALSQTVEVTAVSDDATEDGESVVLGFGTLPDGIAASGTTSATVSLVDAESTPQTVNTAPTGAPTITGTAQVGETLTASVDGITDADGLENATFAYRWVSSDGTVGADIDDATQSTYELVAGDAGKRIKVRVTFTDDGSTKETLVSAATDVVAAAGAVSNTEAAAPLEAAFEDVAEEHDGSSEFTFRVRFSEEIPTSYRVLRDHGAFTVAGGKVKKARRVEGRDDLREIYVKPDGVGAVTVELPVTTDCQARGAICMDDGRKLAVGDRDTVPGPPSLSVADARAEEGTDDSIDFTVTLSRAASGTVTVDYATASGTATSGEDFTAASSTLTFAAGVTTQIVSVALINDAVNEGEETLTLTLSNPQGAWIEDGEAIGTIENTDPIPKAWTARFGRTVGSHVVDALEERLDTASESFVQLGGHRLGGGPDVREAVERLAPDRSLWEEASADPVGQHMTFRDLLLGSAFHLASSDEEGRASGPRLSAWGRVATSGFDGQEDALSLDGTVTTATLGVDGVWKRWLTGLALAYSEGDGSFTQVEAEGDDLASSLTSLHPYVAYAPTDRVRLWGMVGYGSGSLELSGTHSLSTDLEMTMGALGVRGTVLEAPQPQGGLQLALRSDLLWVRMDTAATEGMVPTEADVSRLRLVLEGSRAFALGEGGQLVPSLEVGLRHDAGDAETGSGVEVAGGLRYASAWGLSIEASMRALVAHEASEYQEWGASGALRFDPGRQGLGLSASLTPAWGSAASGVSRLWGQPDAAGLTADGAFAAAQAGRLDAELGYGLAALKGRGVLTPYVRGALLEGDSQAWHLGARLAMAKSLNLSVEASRRQRQGDVATHELALLASLPW